MNGEKFFCSIRFGTSKKSALNSSRASETPSPGTYSIKSSFSRPDSGFSIFSRREDPATKRSKNLPGPGAYSIKEPNKKALPSWK